MLVGIASSAFILDAIINSLYHKIGFIKLFLSSRFNHRLKLTPPPPKAESHNNWPISTYKRARIREGNWI
jgi:hypothetical protein